MRRRAVFSGVAGAALLSSVAVVAHAEGGDVVLPAPPPPFEGKIGLTYADSTPAFPKPVQAPAGAPNILLVLTDDVGFAASGTFGGPVPTPALDQLAANGLRYTRFHTTAMCSPTRASLLTGRNHHAVGSGIVTDTASGYPGYWGAIPSSAATVADVLRFNGYNTAFFGKHHNVPQGQDDSNMGPFDLWPTGLGFEYFYGFIGGDTNQWRPKLYRGTTPVAAPKMETTLDHYLAEDLIQWVHGQKAAAPDKPFLAYLAPGSAHAPHQAPPEWIAKFKGKFDQGWDRLREESLARQKAAGIVPKNTALTPRPEGIPAWSSLTDDQRRAYAHMMEVFAGMLAYQDNQIGLVLNELKRMGQLDNTLVIFIEGDNGGSPEGDITGSMNELGTLANGMKEDTDWLVSEMPKMGGPDSYQVFPVGWAWATNSPFQWTKQVGSHLGGTRNGMVISWPAKIKDKGGIRTQFAHVNDIMPTILEAVGVQAPDVVEGVRQQKIDGVSLMYSFDSAKAPERHVRQYFELIGNRAMYDHGWMASTTPGRLPWKSGKSAGLPTDYKWELYDLTKDFSQAHDLAASNPEKLAELQAEWDEEAKANNVYPLDDRQGIMRAAGMKLPSPRDFVYWGSNISVAQSKAPPINFRSFSITADVTIPEGGPSGALIASGSKFGGWSFGFDNGKPFVVHAASQKPEDFFRVEADSAIPAGTHTLTYDYALSGFPGQGGTLTISLDGTEIGRGHIGRTAYVTAGLGETFDIGRDTGETVVAMPGGTVFNGKISRIKVSPR
ncbi:arylsulfatase [Croceicoccus estronivorus]|uniref:arylsulfatase n=1 Tax=Croceicoccus estronivorus TaxID=1172626 RepID=UPI00082E33AB|nr:arylsulfatase [Croceicoccus estronivorus]OCC24376.1 arylsulfatase [Croceicoccus estronivorus]